MSSKILIDSCDQLWRHLDRRLEVEVKRGQAAARRAEQIGDDARATKLRHEWFEADRVHGLLSEWTEAWTVSHRSEVLLGLMNGWKPIVSWDEIENAGNDDDEFDNGDDDLAEAAD